MKLAIFGATGRAGQPLVRQALDAGHEVVAFARTPSKLNIDHERLTIVQGDIRDAARVEEAVAGADAVLSVLGPTSNTADHVVSQGVRNILAAMKKHNVRRLIISIGAGVPDSDDEPKLFHKLIGLAVRTLSRNVYEDMHQVNEIVRASDADWTIVRVPMLTDEAGSGEVRVGMVGKGTGPRLARGDMARFMLQQVEDERYLHQAPVISS